MKRNLAYVTDFESITDRINDLRPDSQRLWGRMSAGQVLPHLADQLRICLGDKPAFMRGNALTRWLSKQYALLLTSMPKNLPTIKELDPDREAMTRPTDFEADRQRLLDLMQRYDALPPDAPLSHPVFGQLNKYQLGQLTYVHLDHHLKQFGL